MSQTWFTIQPFEMIEGRRPALFEAFDNLELRIKNAFDDTATAVSAAVFGIDGAVDYYADLPDPASLDIKTIYIVRQKSGSPSGNGLYWVQEVAGTHVWSYLDGLNLQDADEVPYDGTTSGIPEDNVQGAIDWLQAHGGGGGGSSYRTFQKTIDATNIANKSIILPTTPATEADTVVLVREAPNMAHAIDYAVHLGSKSVLWNGLGLDGVISVGDVVTIVYKEI